MLVVVVMTTTRQTKKKKVEGRSVKKGRIFFVSATTRRIRRGSIDRILPNPTPSA